MNVDIKMSTCGIHPPFCVKEVTRQQKETKQQVQRHLRLCAVKVAELWDRLT